MIPEVETSIKSNLLLLVEGREEQYWFRSAFQAFTPDLEGFQVIAYKGKDKLSPFLKAMVRDPAFPAVDAIAVIRDADQNPTGRSNRCVIPWPIAD